MNKYIQAKETGKKIKDYQAEEIKNFVLKLIIKVNGVLKALPSEMILDITAIEFKKLYAEYTDKEIDLAFELYINEKLHINKPKYQVFSLELISAILSAYKRLCKQNDEYIQKYKKVVNSAQLITEKDKEKIFEQGLKNIIERYNENGNDAEMYQSLGDWYYNYITETYNYTPTDEEKLQAKQKAIDNLKRKQLMKNEYDKKRGVLLSDVANSFIEQGLESETKRVLNFNFVLNNLIK
jgi:hypothetical protein